MREREYHRRQPKDDDGLEHPHPDPPLDRVLGQHRRHQQRAERWRAAQYAQPGVKGCLLRLESMASFIELKAGACRKRVLRAAATDYGARQLSPAVRPLSQGTYRSKEVHILRDPQETVRHG